MGYTAAMSQILSIPIFGCATVFAIATAFAADKLRHRFSFVLLGVLVGSTGYAIMLNLTSVSVGVRYLACFLITTGGYIAQPVTLAWLSNQVLSIPRNINCYSYTNAKADGWSLQALHGSSHTNWIRKLWRYCSK